MKILLPADIPQLTPHELRHTYGTNLRRRGVDIYSIQKIMGHKDIKMTTELYVHNEVEELKKAISLTDVLPAVSTTLSTTK
jgi:integrase